MTPLGKVVAGLLLVILDFRIDGFDLLPDLVGWPLVLIGLLPLFPRHGGFAVATVAAGGATLLAIPQQLSEPGPVLTVLETVLETAVTFGTCTGVIAVVAEPAIRRTAGIIRWTDLALTVVATLVGLAARGGTDGAAAGPLLLLAVASLGVAIWFLVFLWSNRRRAELAPTARTGGAAVPRTP